MSSQTLWQHGPNELFLALAVFAFWRPELRHRDAALCGAALGMATLCRPTSAVFATAVAMGFLWKHRALLPAFVAGAAPFALGLATYNTYYLGAPWHDAQVVAGTAIALRKTGTAAVFQTPVWEGLAGLLFSPSRGLLVFSPFFALSFAGLYLSWRKAELQPLRVLGLGACAVLLIEAGHFDWWGGWSFGYRHIVDLAVVLTVLALPALDWVFARPSRLVLFAGLLGWAVCVQAVGAVAYDVVGWNAEPNVDRIENRWRLWSIRDSEIPYYVRNFSQAHASRHEQSEALLRGPEP